jgi:hypothetical protein
MHRHDYAERMLFMSGGLRTKRCRSPILNAVPGCGEVPFTTYMLFKIDWPEMLLSGKPLDFNINGWRGKLQMPMG